MSGGPRPLRAVRVEAKLWEESKKVASQNGDNLSAIIRDALRTYIQENEDSPVRCESCASGLERLAIEVRSDMSVPQRIFMARYIRARAEYYKSEDAE